MRAWLIMAIGFLAGFVGVQALRNAPEDAAPAEPSLALQSPRNELIGAMTCTAEQSQQASPEDSAGQRAQQADDRADAWGYRPTPGHSPAFDEQRLAAIVREIDEMDTNSRHRDLALLFGPERFERLVDLWADLKRQPETGDANPNESYLRRLELPDTQLSSLGTEERVTIARLREQVSEQIDPYAGEQLDYYVKTLPTREGLVSVRTQVLREHMVLSGNEVEALVFAEGTAIYESWSQWQAASQVSDYDHATQLIELKARRILEMMAPHMAAERLRVLERAIQRRARQETLKIANARAGGERF